jgi:hypothetical protein
MNLLVNIDYINNFQVIYQEKLVLSTRSSSHTRHEKRPDLLPLEMVDYVLPAFRLVQKDVYLLTRNDKSMIHSRV